MNILAFAFRTPRALTAMTIALAVVSGFAVPAGAESATPVPPPVVDPASSAATETAVLAGGCF